MLSAIKHIIVPPIFEEDEDKSRIATLLSVTIYTIFLIATIRAYLTYTVSVEYLPFVVRQTVILITIQVVVLIIMHFGYVRFAAFLFTIYQWLAIAFLTFNYGGVSLGVYSFFIFVILASGLLLGGRWAVGYAIISVLYGALLYYLESLGVIAKYTGSSAGYFIGITPSFITSAVLVYLYHRDMIRALTKARNNAAQLKQVNYRLRRAITAQNQAEQDLYLTKFAIDHSADSVFWSRQDGSFVYVNDAACNSLGYSHEELMGMTVPDIDPNFTPYMWKDHWEELKEKGSILLETIHQTKKGRSFPVEVRANFLEYRGKELNCSIARDVSDRKKIEEELHHAQKMEAIGTLAGGIAHDFNNILTAIIGNTELAKLNLGRDVERSEKNLDKILQGTSRARDLVKQILTFSRKTAHEKKPIKLYLIVRDALDLLRASIPSTIAIKREIESQSLVLADSTQMHQIVMNICANAYHAMRESGGTLAIGLKDVNVSEGMVLNESEVLSGTYVRLEVSDTGPGMDNQVKRKIFEPYFTTKDYGDGTGLGLSVVFGIVRSHGGYINVYSEVGQGATFHVYLPVVGNEQAVSPSDATERDQVLNGGSERVMFVDDEIAITDLSKTILSEYGYDVSVFNNGKDALGELKRNPDKYDLVITDMTMPNMTGLELAEKILGIDPDMPIVICSGHSDLLNREKAMAAGIKEYCEKPLGTKDLLDTIRRVLDRKEQNI